MSAPISKVCVLNACTNNVTKCARGALGWLAMVNAIRLSLMKFSLIYLDVRIGCARLDVIILYIHTLDVGAANPIITPSALECERRAQKPPSPNHSTPNKTATEFKARLANSLKHPPPTSHTQTQQRENAQCQQHK